MKLTLPLTALAAVAFVPGLSAQKYHVSPVVATNQTGSSANAFPFTSTVVRRYQQIHSDMPAVTMSIKSIGWRHSAASAYTGMRTLDAEMWMGRSVPWNACSFYFDNNWVQNSKTLVVKRRTVVLTGATIVNPGFDPSLSIKLDQPYIYIPVSGSLAWEIHVHSNVSSGSFGTIDSDNAASTTVRTSSYGSGCVAGGQTTAMQHSVVGADRQGSLILQLSARYCPANAPSLLVIGTKKLDLSVPGLCTNLYTDLLFVLPFGAADANGDLHRQGGTYYYGAAGGVILAANPGAGTLYTQVFSLDTTQSGIALAGSNGVDLTLPAPNTAGKKVEVTRLFNNSGGTTAKMSAVFYTSSMGNGLPTRFEY